MEIQVTAKKWVWQFEYPNGTRTLNELHVPARKAGEARDDLGGRDPQLLRADLPHQAGRGAGPLHGALVHADASRDCTSLLCAEYCGKGHSDMLGKICVDDDEASTTTGWRPAAMQARTMPLAELGAMLYESRGCDTCHSLDGTRGAGPELQGRLRPPGETGRTAAPLLVDENYIRESILQPQAKVVAGLRADHADLPGHACASARSTALIEFIKTLK